MISEVCKILILQVIPSLLMDCNKVLDGISVYFRLISAVTLTQMLNQPVFPKRLSQLLLLLQAVIR